LSTLAITRLVLVPAETAMCAVSEVHLRDANCSRHRDW
jgi:hypothetical protein